MGVNIAQYREIIVQFYSHILHLLQREMILSHLIHVRLEFFCLMPLCQPDVGPIGIISHPLASAIVGIYVWHTTPRQNHLRTMKGRTPGKRFENTIDGKSGSRIIRKREMLTYNITANFAAVSESMRQDKGWDRICLALPINIFCGKTSKKQLSAILILAEMMFWSSILHWASS